MIRRHFRPFFGMDAVHTGATFTGQAGRMITPLASPPAPPVAQHPSALPLRVLMISDVFFPRINGVSTSIETFRRDLGAEGIDVQLVAPDYGDIPTGDDDGLRRVPARRVILDPEDRLMRWPRLVRTVDQVLSAGVDLIHVQTPFAAHYAGVRAARQHGLPVLATYHTHFEEYFHCYLPYAPRPALRAVARALARSQCNALDTVVVPSRAMATAAFSAAQSCLRQSPAISAPSR